MTTPILDNELITKSRFWSFNAGQLATMIIFALGLLYAGAAFVTKSDADAGNYKARVDQMQLRLDAVDAQYSALSTRLTAVETGIVYIRESEDRIERSLNASENSKR